MPALRDRVKVEGEILTFPDTEPIQALQTIMEQQPNLVILERLFADPGVERIVVEPDARNTKIHVLNARLGFLPAGEVALPGKRALLSFCTREAFHAARADLHSSPIRQGAPL